MNFLDILFLTLVSTIACITLPKLISTVLNPHKPNASQRRVITIRKATNDITSFPYCTTYILTKAPACKFSPSFCDRCTSNY
jgi:hypothetical protein